MGSSLPGIVLTCICVHGQEYSSLTLESCRVPIRQLELIKNKNSNSGGCNKQLFETNVHIYGQFRLGSCPYLHIYGR